MLNNNPDILKGLKTTLKSSSLANLTLEQNEIDLILSKIKNQTSESKSINRVRAAYLLTLAAVILLCIISFASIIQKGTEKAEPSLKRGSHHAVQPGYSPLSETPIQSYDSDSQGQFKEYVQRNFYAGQAQLLEKIFNSKLQYKTLKGKIKWVRKNSYGTISYQLDRMNKHYYEVTNDNGKMEYRLVCDHNTLLTYVGNQVYRASVGNNEDGIYFKKGKMDIVYGQDITTTGRANQLIYNLEFLSDFLLNNRDWQTERLKEPYLGWPVTKVTGIVPDGDVYGGDQYIMLIDSKTGLLLKYEITKDNKPVSSIYYESVEYNPKLNHQLFTEKHLLSLVK